MCSMALEHTCWCKLKHCQDGDGHAAHVVCSQRGWPAQGTAFTRAFKKVWRSCVGGNGKAAWAAEGASFMGMLVRTWPSLSIALCLQDDSGGQQAAVSALRGNGACMA